MLHPRFETGASGIQVYGVDAAPSCWVHIFDVNILCVPSCSNTT